MAGPREPALVHGEQLSRVAGEVAAIVRDAWGRGPARTSAYWAGPDIVVLLLENGLTDAERTLVGAGHDDEVLASRRTLQGILRERLGEAVARIVGRSVRTVLSATGLDPAVSAELFLLDAQAAPSAAPAGEAQTLMEHAAEVVGRSQDLGEQARALSAQLEQIHRRKGNPEREAGG